MEITNLDSVDSVVPLNSQSSEKKTAQDELHFLRTESTLYKTLFEHASNHDLLTGLVNRTVFKAQLNKATLNAKHTNKKVAVLHMDLDQFKKINDSLGHNAGDLVLRELAQRLQNTVRDTDTVGRHAGDEFTIVLAQINSLAEVSEIVKRIVSELIRPYSSHSHVISASASIGISMYPDDANNTDDLIQFSDTAMHQAKNATEQNAVQFFDTNTNVGLRAQIKLERELHVAISESQLVLHYQPQFDLRKKAVVSYEALVRWNHPEHGLLGPDSFIAMAEETGLIQPLGEWVIEQTCAKLAELRISGRSDVRISVNVSAKQFNHGNLYKKIIDMLAKTGTPAHTLELELTESALLDNSAHCIEAMQQLHEAGVEVSIDDFGTGYSSFSRLRQLPLSRIKIDKSFVHGIPANPADNAIAKAIISVAHELGMEVVSEGIETQEQAEFFNRMNCDLLQGFYIGKPAPFESLLPAL